MGYIGLGSKHSATFQGVSPLIDLISDNLVLKELKKMGYRTTAFSSGYMATEMRKFDGYISDDWICREVFNVITKQTILAACNLGDWSLARVQAIAHRDAIKSVLSQLPFVAKSVKPAFVFAHILCPHAPFIFSKDGSNVDLPYFDYSDGVYLRQYIDLEHYRKRYVDQLIYLNSLVKDCVSKLIEDKSRKKVIIIQGDHGPASDVDYFSQERSNLVERMSILNAIYLPEGNYDGLKQTQSPVNNFRAVFKNSLHFDVDLLPDRSYYLTFNDLYVFKDITDLVAGN
ncbi:MAG: LTA synthase family protein [Candidatus Riflebacteria bacterium]|nr:LTA synthase family protein [Candidatus Riflebacteria bacterium]